MSTQKRPLFDPHIVRQALADSFVKLDPRRMVRNPVMFVVLVGSVLTTLVLARDIVQHRADTGFTLQIAIWLWFTVLFANFAEAMAEGRGKAQAATLRKARTETMAKRLMNASDKRFALAASSELRKGDFVLCEPGDLIPGDGEVVEGVASVDESAITGESAPVVRESGGDRSAVTGGTKVLSDHLVVRITANPGETFLDRMIALVEGASRQKTPNEIALTILLSGLTIVFLFAVATLQPFAIYSGGPVSIPVLIALLVCLIPTTIGGLLSAIGIAGMDRMIQQNVIAMSGRAVEAAGDVNTLLLDKTGTITLGNRQAVELIPVQGVTIERLADRAQLASLPDETPEGRSVVVLAKEKYNLRGRPVGENEQHQSIEFIPFSATTRMSGVNVGALQLRKGAGDSVSRWVTENNGTVPADLAEHVRRIASQGGTPLVVAERENGRAHALGVIYLKDVVKGGMRERFDRLRAMGIRTVMITGDNPLTAASIAREAGVDDFLAEAKPEDKMALIKREQSGEARRDDRGRDQRRAGARAGGRRCRDEHRNAGGEGSGEHDRSRLEPDEAHRGRRDREAAADDAWCAHDVLDRERRRQILCDHPGDVRRDLPRAAGAQRDAAALAGVGDPGERDLQRAHHRRADPARAARRALSARARNGDPAPQSPGLRRGRAGRAVHRHQAHRCPARLSSLRLKAPRMLRKQLWPAVAMTIVLMIITGGIYPGAVTVFAQLLFPHQANGSLIESSNGQIAGSGLIGQSFARPEYFHSRPSAAGNGYDDTASTGTNKGPTDRKLADTLIAQAVDSAVALDGAARGKVPSDMATSSASGLDPDISPANAALQVARVARARGVSGGTLQALVASHTRGRQLGFLGEPRVNVLALNLALDSVFGRATATASSK